MNRNPDNECLLGDVLSEGAPADFRQALLDDTLRRVRGHRRWRQASRIAGVFSFLALAAALIWREQSPRSRVASAPIAKATHCRLIESHPLSSSEMVSSRPLAAQQIISSTSDSEIVQTSPGHCRLINDDQLLALVLGRSAVLVRTGKNSEQLVFADPKNEIGFPVN